MRSRASAPSRSQSSLAGCLPGQQPAPGSHPWRTSEMSGSHCGITPRPHGGGAMRGLCPVSALPRVSLRGLRSRAVAIFLRGPEHPQPQGAASAWDCKQPVPAGRASSEGERQERRGASGRSVGLTAMAGNTTDQVVVYTGGFLGLFGSSSEIYVHICSVAGSWRMFILIVCQTSNKYASCHLPVS